MTWITADFPDLPASAQGKVKAIVTCREGGVSTAPYASFNLASHVGDEGVKVQTNRAILREEAGLPTQPYWLNQTHSACVLDIPFEYRTDIAADASFTSVPKTVCAVLTADCLPLLVVDKDASEVAAIHAGWRGLASGIVENTLTRLRSSVEHLHVYLGPAIGPGAFEVGEDVRQAFVSLNRGFDACFRPTPVAGKYLADLYQLARLKLKALGVGYISGGEYCTYDQANMFYSYRRDGQTGRMASLIWLEG